MSKDKMILIAIVVLATLVMAPRLRSLPGISKLPTV